MDYNKQVSILEEYIRNGEKQKDNLRLGLELEHFVLDKDTLTAIPYFGEMGVQEILTELAQNDWQPEYEEGFILKLKKKDAVITLEPGSQLEISISPFKSIKSIKNVYFAFLEEIIPVLNSRGMVLMNLGYQPVSSIRDIPLIPKKRYKYMYNYLGNRGIYAHNMMKGTASLQVSIDYTDELDYKKKIQAAYFLSPLIYTIFDNGPFFEGKTIDKGSIRSYIWENCDQARCGLIKGIFNKNYSYRTYAKYILGIPPIIYMMGDDLVFTGDKLSKEIFDPYNYTDLEINHLFSMAFPDIRTKQFLEIRMSDSLPFPYNFGFLALIKGLFYNTKNLDYLYEMAKRLNKISYKVIKNKIKTRELTTFLNDKLLVEYFLDEILVRAREGLEQEERKYLDCLLDLFKDGLTFKEAVFQELTWFIGGPRLPEL